MLHNRTSCHDETDLLNEQKLETTNKHIITFIMMISTPWSLLLNASFTINISNDLKKQLKWWITLCLQPVRTRRNMSPISHASLHSSAESYLPSDCIAMLIRWPSNKLVSYKNSTFSLFTAISNNNQHKHEHAQPQWPTQYV